MIYLLRHGEDDEQFIGGWSDVDLTPVGIKQVKDIVAFIKKKKLNITKIYSSDLKRTIRTTEIISKELGIVYHHTPLLRELNKGTLTGMKIKAAKEKYPQYFQTMDINTRYPNGESMLDLYHRIKSSLDTTVIEDNTLIITHRGVINMIYYILNHMSPDMNKDRFGVTHASLHEMDIKKQEIKRIAVPQIDVCRK
ncbi:MAG: phosphoglycerate mutase family protein [Bacilli bacterium]|nr:phosphoglycerate mutase family protein [Bacilli bacterium]MDD4298736.1 phosphoglycerate mutase family protein [Bacilli bacterium]MDD4643652.1 phosphoglycerate mutase family protein [Bacilli bacterium]